MTLRKKICVIAPASSMSAMPSEMRQIGISTLSTLGFTVVFGQHVNSCILHTSGAISDRLADINGAFHSQDNTIVMSVFGGYTSNQLLEYLDFEELARHRKRFVGFSDVTALLLPLATQTSISAYHGPSFSVFCDPAISDYTTEGFVRCLADDTVTYRSPDAIASDKWWLKKNYGPRDWASFEGWKIYSPGEARGRILGGNLETICALAGTKFFPSFRGRILFIEDATGETPGAFHRDLVHLAQMGVLRDIIGLIVGKPPMHSALSEAGYIEYILREILGSAPSIPVLYDVNCSHVDPTMTIPLERDALLLASGSPSLQVNLHT